jgi:hypothetical protein
MGDSLSTRLQDQRTPGNRCTAQERIHAPHECAGLCCEHSSALRCVPMCSIDAYLAPREFQHTILFWPGRGIDANEGQEGEAEEARETLHHEQPLHVDSLPRAPARARMQPVAIWLAIWCAVAGCDYDQMVGSGYPV